MAKEADTKTLQEKYMEYQMLEQMVNHLQEQMQKIEGQMVELISVKQSLDDLKKAKKGSEMMVPIANGIFVKGELKDNEDLIINVGGNIAVNKSIEDAKHMLEKQFGTLQQMQQDLMVQLQKYGLKAQSVQEELAALIQE
jgi:prefoldin alpha subunit